MHSLSTIDQALFGAAMIEAAAVMHGEPWRGWVGWLAVGIILEGCEVPLVTRILVARSRAEQCISALKASLRRR